MRNLIYILAIILFVSCDCYKVASGIVVDKTTSLPIQGVKVCLSDQPNTFSYTDSSGNYSIHYVKWGIGCYTKVNKKVVAEKKDYKKSDVVPAMDRIELESESASTQEFSKSPFINFKTNSKKDSLEGMPVFSVVEKMPEFSGGDSQMFLYINKNMKLKERCLNGLCAPPSKIYISFIIDTAGKTRNVEIMRDTKDCIHPDFIEAIKNMPNWKPGIQSGKEVPVKMILPIHINWK